MKKLRSGRRRKESSRRWLTRQLNDPYVAKAKTEGYRSRAAYKLLEIDARLKIFRKGQHVVDLGAAPGGWTQVALKKIGESGRLVATDILPMEKITGAFFLQLDFSGEDAPRKIMEALGGKADVLLSDMAPNTIGHTRTDHLRIMALAELAADFASHILKPGGTFITKVFQGGAGAELISILKKQFESVRHVKPPASRTGSAEIYLVAQGFRD